jgi:hypothetical protein
MEKDDPEDDGVINYNENNQEEEERPGNEERLKD